MKEPNLMNKLKHLLILLVLTVSFNMFSQSGIYVREPNLIDGTKMKWTLSLEEDGAFLYHFLRDITGEANPEENYYGKGTWVLEGKSITFFSKELDNLKGGLYTINLNNSKARYITKSPRDKTDKVIKKAIRFYESETFHIKGLILFKE